MEIYRVRWLDASAIIKFLLEEQGSQQVRTYLAQHGPFDTAWLCLGEVFGRLKAAHEHKEMTREEYLAQFEILLGWVSAKITKVYDIPRMDFLQCREVEKLVRKYPIDFSDAVQVHILKTDDFLSTHNPILITADRQLAKAARNEGLDAWDCKRDPSP
jgi:predicted nucleic acid-binding protein